MPLSANKLAKLSCQTSGSRPPAVLTWWKGSKKMLKADNTYFEDSNVSKSVLTVVPSSEDNNVYLACRSENPNMPNSAKEDGFKLQIYCELALFNDLPSTANCNPQTLLCKIYRFFTSHLIHCFKSVICAKLFAVNDAESICNAFAIHVGMNVLWLLISISWQLASSSYPHYLSICFFLSNDSQMIFPIFRHPSGDIGDS